MVNTTTTTPTTCPSDSIPAIESLPVPHNINLMIMPGTNTSAPPMLACCAPSRVQIVDGCWLWCELPAAYFSNGSASHETVEATTSACLRANGRNHTESKITGWQFNAAGRTRVGSAKGVGLWVLVLSGLMYVV